MTLNNIKIEYDVWYRGLKKIKIKQQTDNTILLSNNDKIVKKGNEIYLNNKLICNIEITENDLIDMYTHHLKLKGYKFV